MSRRFKALRHLTLPVELCPAPGATNHMLEPGSEIEIEDARATRHGRFLNNRKAMGDLVELAPGTPSDPNAPAARVITPPGGGEMVINTGMKKEG